MVSNRPILLISGLKDSINPPEMTRTLFARAKEPKESLFLENVGHGGYADASPEIFHKKIVNFFETYL